MPLIKMLESSSYEFYDERTELTPYLQEEDFEDYVVSLVGRFAFIGFCMIAFANFIIYGTM